MSLSLGWLQQLKRAWTIPEVIVERCVHSRCEVASCTRCVQACPHEAWLLDDTSLKIDTARCDGCGLCVAACTEAALGQTLLPALWLLEGRKTLLFACEFSEEGINGDGVVPCLHAVTSSLLLEHYRAGYQQVLSSRGKCETCPRYGGRDLFRERLTQLNKLLASRGVATMRHAEGKSPPAPLLQRGEQESVLTRRRFFQQAVTFMVEKGMERVEASSPKTAVPLPWAIQLPAVTVGQQALFPFVPKLDVASCNGCDTCVQLCPHQALQLEKHEDGRALAYRIQAERCTGCGICADVCERDAVKVRQMEDCVGSGEILLVQATCKACGSRFHYPVDGNALRQYCRICSHTNHYRQLFQVY